MRRLLGGCIESIAPVPAMNCNVAGMEIDAYWDAERFAVELDVYETHGTRAAFERDEAARAPARAATGAAQDARWRSMIRVKSVPAGSVPKAWPQSPARREAQKASATASSP